MLLKDQVSTDASEAQARKLPMAERAARLAEQQRRLSGVTISGELQPSFALVDKVNHILESGQLVWISPSATAHHTSLGGSSGIYFGTSFSALFT